MKQGRAIRRRTDEGVCEVDYVDPVSVREAMNDLPSASELQRAGEALKYLAHSQRLRILMALDGRELCVCDISEVLQLSMSGTSQHLRELRNLGAVNHRVSGKLVYYSLADRFWRELAGAVVERFCVRDGNGIGKLR